MEALTDLQWKNQGEMLRGPVTALYAAADRYELEEFYAYPELEGSYRGCGVYDGHGKYCPLAAAWLVHHYVADTAREMVGLCQLHGELVLNLPADGITTP